MKRRSRRVTLANPSTISISGCTGGADADNEKYLPDFRFRGSEQTTLGLLFQTRDFRKETISKRKSRLQAALSFFILCVCAVSFFDSNLRIALSRTGENGKWQEKTLTNDDNSIAESSRGGPDHGEGVFQWKEARSFLDALTAIGPRLVGTHANEVDTPALLLSTLRQLQESVQHPEEAPGCRLQVEIQRPSGTFFTPFLGGFTSVYREVTNVVAKVSWGVDGDLTDKEEPPPPSILVNAHFDTAPGSPGGSDDGAAVSIMVGLLHALVTGPPSPDRRSVVFLFNGAEEPNQQGAHGFITQHRWASDLGVVVNLESMGSASGRLHVFQCNSHRVARSLFQGAASSAPSLHPFGSVIGHELFSGVLSKTAATDFRTFLEFGPPGLVGFDTAYIDEGHVYHTSMDDARHVTDASLHHSGTALLAFLRAASRPESGLNYATASSSSSSASAFLNREGPRERLLGGGDGRQGGGVGGKRPHGRRELPPVDGGSVFFDFLHTWWIVYPAWFARSLHAAAGVCGLAAVALAAAAVAPSHSFKEPSALPRRSLATRSGKACWLTVLPPPQQQLQQQPLPLWPWRWRRARTLRVAAVLLLSEVVAVLAAAVGAALCGLFYTAFAPMVWNGTGAPASSSSSSSSSSSPFSAACLPWLIYAPPALAAATAVRARAAEWLLRELLREQRSRDESGGASVSTFEGGASKLKSTSSPLTFSLQSGAYQHPSGEIGGGHLVDQDSGGDCDRRGRDGGGGGGVEKEKAERENKDDDDDDGDDDGDAERNEGVQLHSASRLWVGDVELFRFTRTLLEVQTTVAAASPFSLALVFGSLFGVSSSYLALPWVATALTFSLLRLSTLVLPPLSGGGSGGGGCSSSSSSSSHMTSSSGGGGASDGGQGGKSEDTRVRDSSNISTNTTENSDADGAGDAKWAVEGGGESRSRRREAATTTRGSVEQSVVAPSRSSLAFLFLFLSLLALAWACVAFTLLLQSAVHALRMLIPLLGRSGVIAPPDPLLAALTGVFSALGSGAGFAPIHAADALVAHLDQGLLLEACVDGPVVVGGGVSGLEGHRSDELPATLHHHEPFAHRRTTNQDSEGGSGEGDGRGGSGGGGGDDGEGDGCSRSASPFRAGQEDYEANLSNAVEGAEEAKALSAERNGGAAVGGEEAHPAPKASSAAAESPCACTSKAESCGGGGDGGGGGWPVAVRRLAKATAGVMLFVAVAAAPRSSHTAPAAAAQQQQQQQQQPLPPWMEALSWSFGGLRLGGLGWWPSYSPERPMRVWMAHVHREFVHSSSASSLFSPWSPSPSSSASPLVEAGAQVVGTEGVKIGEREGARVVTDSGLWVMGMDFRNLQPLRLAARTSLSPHHEGHENEEVAAPRLCSAGSATAECYLNWPFYFPIADAIFGGVYLPAPSFFDPSQTQHQLPLHSSKHRQQARKSDAVGLNRRAKLTLSATSSPTTPNPSLASTYFSSAAPLPPAALTGSSESTNHLRRREEEAAAAAAAIPAVKVVGRKVHVTVRGPDHMVIVLRDAGGGGGGTRGGGAPRSGAGRGGARQWEFGTAVGGTGGSVGGGADGTPHFPNEESAPPQRSEHDDRRKGGRHQQLATITGWSFSTHLPPPRENDNVRLVQLTHGQCPPLSPEESSVNGEEVLEEEEEEEAQNAAAKEAACTHRFSLDLMGPEGSWVDLSVYGHYTQRGNTKALAEFRHSLPVWARGAEWCGFSSALVRTSV